MIKTPSLLPLTIEDVKKEENNFGKFSDEEIQILIENLDEKGFHVFKKLRFIHPVNLYDGKEFDTWKLGEAAIYCHYTKLMSHIVHWIKNEIAKNNDIKTETLIEKGRDIVIEIGKIAKKIEIIVDSEYPSLSNYDTISHKNLQKMLSGKKLLELE